MTLSEAYSCTLPYLTASHIADILHCDPHSIRMQAHTNPAALGFPVIVIGRRVRVPRVPFLAYMEGPAHA